MGIVEMNWNGPPEIENETHLMDHRERCSAQVSANRGREPGAPGYLTKTRKMVQYSWPISIRFKITPEDQLLLFGQVLDRSRLAARGEKHFSRADVHDGDSAIAWRLER